jgi:hypothetical protein
LHVLAAFLWSWQRFKFLKGPCQVSNRVHEIMACIPDTGYDMQTCSACRLVDHI